MVKHFIKEFSRKMNKEVIDLTSQAMQMLMLQDWPGNVRQLKNTIEYAVAMTQQNVITEDLLQHQREVLSESALPSLKEAKADFEKGYLIHLLEMTAGNISKAADLAGMSRIEFLETCGRYRVSVYNYSPDEAEGELRRDLEEARKRIQ